MQLPSVTIAVIPRPGTLAKKAKQFVPNPEYVDFWIHWYDTFRKNITLNLPVPTGEESIDPLFGYFGMRYHPVIKKPGYFHAGLDITVPPKTQVKPLLPGILEYAGFGAINGNYVMLSHPDVATEDGYVLTTSIMHLKEASIGFTSYQKMLREISLHSYPQVAVNADTIIGKAGNSGILNGYHSHVHIQCELRNKKNSEAILLDPAQLFGFASHKNLSRDTANDAEFQKLQDDHADIVKRFHLERYWKAE